MNVIYLICIIFGAIFVVMVLIAIFSFQLFISLILKYWKITIAIIVIFVCGYYGYNKFEEFQARRRIKEYNDYVEKNYPKNNESYYNTNDYPDYSKLNHDTLHNRSIKPEAQMVVDSTPRLYDSSQRDSILKEAVKLLNSPS